ncbi:hypothetical protein KI440_04010 [Candidatus Saccharibacteria bacterium TM7i]|nr:hypothetical protein KI440_04010 [Candidatus Saccharibacteria bacterium TM7i]
MDADILKTPYGAVRAIFAEKFKMRSVTFEYEKEEGYEPVVKAGLPAKLGLDNVPTDDLYGALRQLVDEGVIDESFGVRKMRAGINDSVEQLVVTYLFR